MAAGGENTAQRTKPKLHEAVFVNGFGFKGIARFCFPNHPKAHGTENEMSNGHNNHERIPIAPMLVVLQAHRAHCPDPQHDSMVGLGLPQAGHF